MANKVKGNIKVNVIDSPGFGATKDDTIEDIAILTGAKVINEALGDDLDLIETDVLGEAIRCVTDDKNTVLQINELKEVINERLKVVKKLIKNEKNGFLKKKHEERLAMLSGSVGIVKVGADSQVELKEKRDRVEDAIHATKAALKEGIIPGGGIALLNAASKITPANLGEKALLEAIKAPYNIILENAGLKHDPDKEMAIGIGTNVITGNKVKMIDAGIIDPVLVTKSALKNAVSVVSTIISADCVISNIRIDNASS
jgi:chaperonin GroEL